MVNFVLWQERHINRLVDRIALVWVVVGKQIEL